MLKQLFIESKNDKHELSKLIDKYLIPQDLEKKKNAEISTPYSLRQEMIQTIPEEFWTNPQKVFEPCCGKGGFLIDIYNKFRPYLSHKVILNECIYFADINPINIFICKLLLNPENDEDIKLNSYEGNTLEMKFDMKFDLVIGNPPYNSNQGTTAPIPIYNLFIEKLIDECKYLLFVIPSRWFVGGKGLNKFRKFMINRKDIKLIKHVDNSKLWFHNVEIQGGVNYFLKDSSYNNNCIFNNTKYNLSKYKDCIIQPIYHSIIDKLDNHTKLIELYKTRNLYKYETNDKRLKTEGNIKCYVSHFKSKERVLYTNDFTFNETNLFWKVITPSAGIDKFGFKKIITSNDIYTNSYISFKVETELEGIHLISYMNTKLCNYMLHIKKISQHINEKVCSFIPLVPLDKIWNDTLVYKHFNLTIEEIEIIENYYK